jgi:hypothetical protein
MGCATSKMKMDLVFEEQWPAHMFMYLRAGMFLISLIALTKFDSGSFVYQMGEKGTLICGTPLYTSFALSTSPPFFAGSIIIPKMYELNIVFSYITDILNRVWFITIIP